MLSVFGRGRPVAVSLLLAGLLVFSACGLPVEGSYPERNSDGNYDPAGSNKKPEATVFGPTGLGIGGKGGGQADSGGGGGIGVNSYLWRASLDTVAFMPLASADPFGGVIITDWYAPAATPSERFKVTVYILDRRLRADGVKVTVFKQSRDANDWSDQKVAPETATKMEDAILARARQLRIDSAAR